MILAFDTSGPIGSVAVAAHDEVLARALMTRQASHASALVPTIDAVLEEGGVDLAEVEVVVVGEGPGSFTGVRVAAATAKGLCRALGVPLRTVSSLAAAALAAESGGVRYALFDARSQRVYGACYAVGGDRVRTLVPPHAGELGDVLESTLPDGTVFVGEAATKHRELIEGAGHDVVEVGAGGSLADGLVRYLALHPETPPVDDLSGWEPLYVRASSAERLWPT